MRGDDICNHPGCSQPKHRQANGKAHQFCHEHMREYWRQKSEEKLERQRNKQPKRAYEKRQPAPHGYSPVEKAQPAAMQVREFERCSVCHRTPNEARIKAQQGIICTHCHDHLSDTMQPAERIRIVRINYAKNCLDVLHGIEIRSLPMPDTEGELNKLLDEYAVGGYMVAR